jgi:hypothetical protein
MVSLWCASAGAVLGVLASRRPAGRRGIGVVVYPHRYCYMSPPILAVEHRPCKDVEKLNERMLDLDLVRRTPSC